MEKFGLDLGSSSIGWTLRDDNNNFKSGVITFKSGMLKGTGGYSSPTKDRREARSKRRLLQARKYRKWELLEVLLDGYVPLGRNELEIWSKYKKGQVQRFPENENFLKWLKCDFSYIEVYRKYNNPYELRVNALDSEKELHKHEIGRALYHLVQRRGYKDIGESDKETEKQIERRKECGFQKALDQNRTIAEALQKEFLDKGKRARNQYPYREEYERELLKILTSQGFDISKNDKGEFKNEFVQNVWTAIIWQRPLRTQKGNIGKCTLEPSKPRCPISHPIFEVFRTWGFINTIKYYDENGKKNSLDKKERILLYKYFLQKEKNFKFEEIKRLLDKQLGKNTKYNYPINRDGVYDTSVPGMPVCKELVDLFGDIAEKSLENIHQYDIGNAPKMINGYSIYDIWHVLFSFDEKTAKDSKFLEKFAIEKLNINNKETKKGGSYNPFAKLKHNITSGYADLSIKAMRKIIPFLKEGYLYSEAVVLAKIPELMNTDWEQKKDTVRDIAQKAHEKYNWNKNVIGITNNLIEQYKGKVEDWKENGTPLEAYNDFSYKLNDYDINDINNTCIGYFGEKTWKEKKEDERVQIIDSVKEYYQSFFNDTKRAYKKTLLLSDIFRDLLKEYNIEIRGELYHHSNTENKYGNLILDKKTRVIILPEARIDGIKNPMFNKSMSILRKLINYLILNKYIDEETEVIIEVGRELNENNKRVAIERFQKNREEKREKYREFLKEFNQKENRNINIEKGITIFELWTEQIFEEVEDEKGKKVNKNIAILKEKEAIKRYELWAEQKGQCMYTGNMISIAQLFSNEIDIEHTIPRSILPDNTMANQTVAYAWYNRDKKKKKIPTECENFSKDVEGWGTKIDDRLKKWEEERDSWKKRYEERLKPKGNEDDSTKNKRIQEKHYFKMHYDYWKDKIERFTAIEVKDSWARRQLTDTQIISKYAREFLKTYFKKVSVQKGSVTADFRKIYNFQEEDEIKNRNKHTHHAIDAAVLTLIPANSSHRDRLIREYYESIENFKPIVNKVPFANFNSQNIIQTIEKNTLIINYDKDKILNQTSKNVRKRGKLQYLKDKDGKFKLDKNGDKIRLIAKGDTVRSVLFAQTYLGKIKDVERNDDGKPIRTENDWKYKTGTDEFIFVKREPIDKVKAKDDLIKSIIDPHIRKLVEIQKNKSEIKDYQGNTIRHVRIKVKAGKEVKERVNYTSKHDYKNKFYSESGSIPYAILLQRSTKGKIEREMIPIASYEIARSYKRHGKFIINDYLQKYDEENKTQFSKNYPDARLLKVGQKVIILQQDSEYEKCMDIAFQTNRLYKITQFKYDGSKIMLQHHLEAQAKSDIDKQVKAMKDSILRKEEIKLGIPEIQENTSLIDIKSRRNDFEKRLYDFTTRLKIIEINSSVETAQKLKSQIEEYKTESSGITIEGDTPILGLSKNNWNFLFEGEDFKISLFGKLEWIEASNTNLKSKA